MTGIENVALEQAIVHRLGNPTRNEQLHLSVHPLTLNDEWVRSALVKYFLHSLNENEKFHFVHMADLAQNEVFSFAKALFNEKENFVAISQQIARFLYSKSTHVRVKEGELYIARFKNIPFENDFVDAVGIFKSESKESFLRVFEHGQGFELSGEEGVNINKLDKGCLVLKQNEAEGYRVLVVDNTNRQNDAQYWVKDFLQVAAVSDEYHFTHEYLQVVKQFATQEMPENFEVTKGQTIDLMQRGLEYFKDNEQFNLNDFKEQVIQHPEMVEQFAVFKDQYALAKSVQFEDEFAIDLNAVKKQSKTFKSVLKLDRNFHIYIHGRRDLIERGFDETTGKYYYKIFFEEEA